MATPSKLFVKVGWGLRCVENPCIRLYFRMLLRKVHEIKTKSLSEHWRLLYFKYPRRRADALTPLNQPYYLFFVEMKKICCCLLPSLKNSTQRRMKIGGCGMKEDKRQFFNLFWGYFSYIFSTHKYCVPWQEIQWDIDHLKISTKLVTKLLLQYIVLRSIFL